VTTRVAGGAHDRARLPPGHEPAVACAVSSAGHPGLHEG